MDELADSRGGRIAEQVVVYNRKGHNVAGEEFDNQSSNQRQAVYVPGSEGHSRHDHRRQGPAALYVLVLRHVEGGLRPVRDVIHYHAEGPCVPLRLAHWAGIRTVATIHGLDWQQRASRRCLHVSEAW